MLLSLDDQVIIAQCTPRASGAIALLRISGTGAIDVAQHISKLASGKLLTELPTHTIHYGNVVDCDGSIIDQVMFLLMRSPKTFTGQDTVEITCHNNQFIIEKIISVAIAAGARLAQEGEFTKRSVLNGKIDLLQAEAIHELIHAQTQMALKKSLSQLTGSFSYWLASIEKELIKALALSEASFEFLDEEMEFAPQIKAIIQSVKTTISSIKKTFNQQQQIRQGIRIVIIGSVNAGKSSLFNALLNQERAIVNAIAGTTRDAIEAGVYTKGNYWTLVDTAGLRQTNDIIEQEGIRRSFEQAQTADIILLTYDSSRSLTDEEQTVYEKIQKDYSHKIIAVHTKADSFVTRLHAPASLHIKFRRAQQDETPTAVRFDGGSQRNQVEKSLSELPTHQTSIFVSSKTKYNINAVEEAIEHKIATLFATIESPFLLNQRQHNLLIALDLKLDEINTMLCKRQVAYELLSIHLNDAIAHLAELSGKAISEAGMDMVFREFCIGK